MEIQKEVVVPFNEVKSFIVRCMQAVGTRREHAETFADLLATADYRGHQSHGLNRIDIYMRDIQSGTTVSGDLEPTVVKETAATALVDGNSLLGPVVGKFCVDLALEKARESGIGWVSVRGSNHFGIAGWYSMRAAQQGMVGLAFTNTSPYMVPTRAKQAALGTSAISCAAPAKDGDSFVLDMASTAVAMGKIELRDRKGLDIPKGWAVDREGKETTNPKNVEWLMPLGGSEETGGYKGYGIGIMVEIFCGILSGASYGPHIRKWKTVDTLANLVTDAISCAPEERGHCFVAIDPGAFADGFSDRLSDLMNHCRGLEPADGESEVLVAGDPEKRHMEKCDKLGGIPYHSSQIQFVNTVAAKHNVEPIKCRE
ncbi:hypothetical protein ScPMuIL_016260 [Solemya velum]